MTVLPEFLHPCKTNLMLVAIPLGKNKDTIELTSLRWPRGKLHAYGCDFFSGNLACLQFLLQLQCIMCLSAVQDTTRCYHLLLCLLKDDARSVRVQASVTFAKAAEILYRGRPQDDTTLSISKTLLTGEF